MTKMDDKWLSVATAESSGNEKYFYEMFQDFEPRFPERLFETEDDWKGLAKKIADKESIMENKDRCLYGVDCENIGLGRIGFKKRDAKIIYENDEYYYVLFTAKYVLPVQKIDVVKDSGDFKRVYYQEKSEFYMPSHRTLFLTEKLRDEFYEACKKYWKIWDEQEIIECTKKRIANLEENIKKEKDYLERLNNELIELNHGAGENG